jgi:catechol 2,3-dioxygenase-like lactoylglutathione lyase family enzyme
MTASIVVSIFVAGFIGGLAAAAQKPASPPLPAERVTGIGGVFFKAREPKALSEWYRDHLGVALMEGTEFAPFPWREREDPARVGTTVWALFPADTKHFAPGQAVMVNYRVRDLDRMLAQLRAAGVQVEPKVMDDFNGKFAWATDPEGNKIELWEPKAGF